MENLRYVGRFASIERRDNIENVRSYFENKYPDRTGLSGIIFRRKEDQRTRLAREWFPSARDISVLDIGCGDGRFLSGIFDGVLRSLTLEDLVPANIQRAKTCLEGRADELNVNVTDSYQVRDNKKHDLVLAIGLFDYYDNWPDLILKLLDRTKGILMADFPKSGTLHSVARKIWLGLNHIKLSTINSDGLIRLLKSTGGNLETRELDFNFMIRIIKPGAACR